jgi:3-oxoadipate enol-lactonase
MPYATLNDVSLHYALDGDPSAPVLLLSNSLGTSLDVWEPQLAELRQHFYVLRYDTRGHGMSDVTSGPYSISQLGGDVIGLLDHLKIERAHICGLSMGGITAMWLALNHPERVNKLVLCNTAPYIGPSDNWTTRAAAVQRDGVASIAGAVVSRWLTPEYAQQHAAQVAYLVGMLSATAAEGYAASCIAVRDNDLRKEVSGIHAETLIIAGSGDLPTPPSEGQFLRDQIKNSQYIELAAAHLSNQQQVTAFGDALLHFLHVSDPKTGLQK